MKIYLSDPDLLRSNVLRWAEEVRAGCYLWRSSAKIGT